MDIIRECDDALPIVDVLVKPQAQQPQGEEDEAEDYDGEYGRRGRGRARRTRTTQRARSCGRLARQRTESRSTRTRRRTRMPWTRQKQRSWAQHLRAKASTATSSTADKSAQPEDEPESDDDEADTHDRARFCLHPQHRLRLTTPYQDEPEDTSKWSCDVCGRGSDVLPGGLSWHCRRCRWDVCTTCFGTRQRRHGGRATAGGRVRAGSRQLVSSTPRKRTTAATTALPWRHLSTTRLPATPGCPPTSSSPTTALCAACRTSTTCTPHVTPLCTPSSSRWWRASCRCGSAC